MQNQVVLSVALQANLPQDLILDPLRFRQILNNIIGNAIKFTTRGEVKVRVAASQTDGLQLLKVQVEDNGVGISDKQVANLFRPFSQADSSITRRFGGTGLGLILSRKLAQALGGDLKLLRSELGRGSQFEITVAYSQKLATDILNSSTEIPVSLANEVHYALKNCRILVADDSRDNQILISRILRISGADVQLANDGVEAVEQALAGDFDLVLMDIQMPHLSGHEATAKLRKNGFTKPVIALTAQALQEDRQKCLSSGCNDYLTKPIQRVELIQTIRFYCAH